MANIVSYDFTEVEYKRMQIESTGVDDIYFGITLSLTVKFKTRAMQKTERFGTSHTWCDLVFSATISDDIEKVTLERIMEKNSIVHVRDKRVSLHRCFLDLSSHDSAI